MEKILIIVEIVIVLQVNIVGVVKVTLDLNQDPNLDHDRHQIVINRHHHHHIKNQDSVQDRIHHRGVTKRNLSINKKNKFSL